MSAGDPGALEDVETAHDPEAVNKRETSLDDFPNEVLARILDHVPPLSYIARMSHVSRRWRSVAHAHPTFCRYIELMYTEDEARPSPARGALFVKQITSSDQPIHLTIMLLKRMPEIAHTLLPLLSEHMHRIASLCLELHLDSSPDLLFSTLNRPAPLLKWLRLDLQGNPLLFAFTRRVLPRMIFAGQSTLKSLVLSRGIDFPDGPVSGLESVERVALSDVSDLSRIQRAMQSCPSIRRLDLVLDPVTDQDASTYFCTPEVAQLQHIYYRTMPDIVPHYRQLLADFVGPLRVTNFYMTYYGPECPTVFDVTIIDKNSGRERRFGDNNKENLEATGELFAALGIAARVVELTVAINALDVMAELFPTMPDLEVITVTLSYLTVVDMLHPPIGHRVVYNANDDWKDTAWIECPAVKKVVIAGDGETCTTQWLANFMGYTLGATCRRHLELELRGVILDGNPREIWGYFKAIHMTPATT